jgi:hypothetical protein
VVGIGGADGAGPKLGGTRPGNSRGDRGLLRAAVDALHPANDVALAGRNGFNSFVYAPKDDPYLRAKWRERYPPAELGRLEELAHAARAAGVRLIYQIAPGLDMRYSDREDRTVLLAKLDQVRTLGVTDVMLSFDDIAREFTWATDRMRYGADGLGTAHAEVAGGVLRWVRSAPSNGTLIVVPVDYYGQEPTPYRQTLGAMLDPAAQLVWTGPATIAAAEADAVARVYRRPPLLWDNFPVNDFDPDHLHLTPVAGRAPDLPSHLAGWLANPMPQAEASKVGLATVGAYLKDPHDYDPARAWTRSIEDLGGSAEGVAALRRLADNSQSTGVLDDLGPVWTQESTALVARMDALFPSLGGPWWESALASLEQEIRAQESLDLGATGNEKLLEEARPWVDALQRNARAGRSAVQLLRAIWPRIEPLNVSREGTGYRIQGMIHRPYSAEIERLRARLNEEVGVAAQAAQHTHGLSISFLAAVPQHGARAPCRRSSSPSTADPWRSTGRAVSPPTHRCRPANSWHRSGRASRPGSESWPYRSPPRAVEAC